MIPGPVIEWLELGGFGRVTDSRPVGGGCINNGQRLGTSSGETFFLKTNSSAPENMFAREAEGLEALRIDGGPRVPRPFLTGRDFLLLEDLAPAPRRPDYWAEFGHRLAALHTHTAPQFGFHHDNYLGSTPQPNPWTKDGYLFFARHRLVYQAELANGQGLLTSRDVHRVEALAKRLPDLIPEQPASLLHGDLWSGNATADAGGNPALIDPAVYYGWAEAELGMTALFGGFPQVFYQAYQEVYPLEDGVWERLDLYNLYHLLNHLNLFGTGYLGQVQSVLKRFGV